MSICSNPVDARESNSVCTCKASAAAGMQGSDGINGAIQSLNRAIQRTFNSDIRGRRFLGSIGAGSMDAPCTCEAKADRATRG